MFYFKRITIPNLTQDQLEQALRKASLKRMRPLDLNMSSMDIGTDKYFLGYEAKEGLRFTRVRTSFERPIPKLIIKLSPDDNDGGYSIRFGILTIAWLLIITVFILLLLLSITKGDIEPGSLAAALIPIGIVVAGFYLELYLTTSRVEKAVRKYIESAALKATGEL